MPGHVAIVYRSQIFQEISFTCLIQAFSKYTIFGRGGWVGVASQGWLTIAWYVAVECVQRSLKMGFFNETKNLRVKQKMMFEFQNFQHSFFLMHMTT